MRMTNPCGSGGAGLAGLGAGGGSSFDGPVIWTSTAGLLGWSETETGAPSFIAKSGQYFATRKRIGSPSPCRLNHLPSSSRNGQVLLVPFAAVTVTVNSLPLAGSTLTW